MSEASLFDLVIHSPESERHAILDRETAGQPELRQRVERLVAAHDRRMHGNETRSHDDPQLSRKNSNGTAEPTLEHSRDLAGLMIAGKYKLIERIGEGGMGDVWLAQQTEPVKRQVAVKLIKAGMDSKQVLARFEAERQALAMMDHPNIAKVLDGGLHENRPYFVMELVKGVPITEYCDHHKLTPKQRLELFVPVCQAIQHAHQKGVIHRDIKPSNVLIALYDDRPVPKVIDFGVAKATGPTLTEHTLNTGFGGLVGTPQYMSPEQATFNNLDIDTRSDVYSLGVLLYELLTGSPPFARKELENKGLLEMLRVVREEEPPKPSTKLSTADALPTLSANRGMEPKKLTGILRNELDWLVMKALEKDRTRRYETANGFAADVSRYLSGEPVLAHPPSAGYRLRKFVRKNQGAVAATGLVLFSLLAGLVATSIAYQQAVEERTRANAAEKNATDNALAAMDAANSERKAKEEAEAEKKKAVEFRDKALDALRATTGDDVEMLLGAKKDLTANEKAYLEAIARRWQTFARQEGTDEQSRAIAAEGHFRVALLWQKLGRRNEALPEYEQAVGIREKLAADFPSVPDYSSDLAKDHTNLGTLLKDLGKWAEAEEQCRKGLAIQEKLVADFPAVPDIKSDLAQSHTNLGILLIDLGKQAEAEGHYRKGLTIGEKLAADFPAVPEYRSNLARSHGNLGTLLAGLGKRAEAEVQYRKGLAIQEKLAAEFPVVPEYRKSLARSHNNLGVLLDNLGKRAEAEEQYGKGLAIQEKLAADFPAVPEYRSDLAGSHTNLGVLLMDLGKGAEAEGQYRKGLAIGEKLAADFPAVPGYWEDLARSYTNLGLLLMDLGKGAEAEEQYRKGLAIQEKLAAEFPTVPAYRSNLARSHTYLGILLKDLGKGAEAEEQYRKGLAIGEKLAAEFPAVPEYRMNLAVSHTNLGGVLTDLRKGAEAEEQSRKGLAIHEKLAADFPAVPQFRVDLGGSYCNLGILVLDSGKPADSLTWFDKAIKTLRPVHEAEPRDAMVKQFLRNTYFSRAMAYERLQKFAEAVKDWERVIQLCAAGELAWAHFNHGKVLDAAGERSKAEVAFDRGLELREAAVKVGGVGDKDAHWLLAQYLIDRGLIYLQSRRPEESIVWMDRAEEAYTRFGKRWPGPEVTTQLRWCHQNRAVALDRLGRSTEAIKEWDQALERCPKEDLNAVRAKRATSRVHGGMVAEATADVTELIKMPGWNADQWHDFACVYAVASGKVVDKKAEYADRALELLIKAVKAGYKDAGHMKGDTDLDPLRDRVDFKKLMADLENKAEKK